MYLSYDETSSVALKVNIKLITLMIFGLLIKLMIFALLTILGHFETFPGGGGGGWGKSRLKTISVPVGIEIGTELAKTSLGRAGPISAITWVGI